MSIQIIRKAHAEMSRLSVDTSVAGRDRLKDAQSRFRDLVDRWAASAGPQWHPLAQKVADSKRGLDEAPQIHETSKPCPLCLAGAGYIRAIQRWSNAAFPLDEPLTDEDATERAALLLGSRWNIGDSTATLYDGEDTLLWVWADGGYFVTYERMRLRSADKTDPSKGLHGAMARASRALLDAALRSTRHFPTEPCYHCDRKGVTVAPSPLGDSMVAASCDACGADGPSGWDVDGALAGFREMGEGR